jgi:hypothetical protein
VASLYDFLGVSPDADTALIHHAYRAAARRLHPDAAGDEEAMRALNEAWEVLRDPARRAAYDATLDDPFDRPFDPARDPYVGPPGWVRKAPVVAVLAVLLAIFILTAYAAVPAGR